MKVLFACCTVYNIVVSYLLAKTVYEDKQKIIVISDLILNSERLCKNIKKLKFFNDVIIIKEKDTKKHEMEEQINLINLEEINRFHLFGHGSVYTCSIFNKLNKHTEIILTDEGLASYSFEYVYNLWIKALGINKQDSNRICGADYIDIDRIKEIWLFDERLYIGEKFKNKLKRIDTLSYIKNNEKLLRKICIELNYIFDYEETETDFDILFFDQNLGQHNCISRENEKLFLEVLKNTIKGKHFKLKKHPTDYKGKFDRLDFKYLEGENIPWELIYFNNILNKKYSVPKTYITYSSSAVFFYKIVFGETEISRNDSIVFIYKLLHGTSIFNERIKNDSMMIERFKEVYSDRNIFIPNSFEELFKILNIEESSFTIDEYEWNEHLLSLKIAPDIKNRSIQLLKHQMELFGRLCKDNPMKYIIWANDNSGKVIESILDRFAKNATCVGAVNYNETIKNEKKCDFMEEAFDYVLISTALFKDEDEELLNSINLTIIKKEDCYYNNFFKMLELAIKVKKENISEVIVYGAGQIGTALIQVLQLLNINIKYVVDKKEHLWGTFIDDVEIISIDKAMIGKPQVFIIASTYYLDEIKDTIANKSSQIGYSPKIFYDMN